MVATKLHVGAADAGGDRKLVVKYAGQTGDPCDNLYIAGLPAPCVDQAALEESIGAMGFTIARTKVIPDTRGRGSSAAMVQFQSVDEASSALEMLDGSDADALAPATGHAINHSYTRALPASGHMTVKFAGDGNPSDNIYISGLPPPSVDAVTLNEVFTEYGYTVVRSKIIPDTRGTGSSAAMVRFASVDEASHCVDGFHGRTWDELGFAPVAPRSAHGRAIVVPPRNGGWPIGASAPPSYEIADVNLRLAVKYKGDASVPSDNLYITGLPSPTVEHSALDSMFAALGLTVVRSKTIPDTKGLGHSAAMVQLGSLDEAAAAISNLNGQQWATVSGNAARPAHDNTLTVKYQGYVGDTYTPSDNLYLTGLPSPSVSQAALIDIFVKLGLSVVRSKTIPDTKGLGHSAAMVQLGSLDEAALAISSLNGQQWATVVGMDQESAPMPTRETADGHPGLTVKYQGDSSVPSDNLYISGLPSPSIDQRTLDDMFATLGLTIIRSRIIPDTKGLGHSAAMVQLASVDEAAYAISELSQDPTIGGKLAAAVAPRPTRIVAPTLRRMVVLEPPAKRQRMNPGVEPMHVKFKGENEQPSDTLYMRGLPSPQVEQVDLERSFHALGATIAWLKIIPDTKGLGKSAAMVQLNSTEEASAAIEAMDGKYWSEWLQTLGGAKPRAPPRPWEACSQGQNGRSHRLAPPLRAPPPNGFVSDGGPSLNVKYSGADQQPSDSLYISGLPSPCLDMHDLNALFVDLGLTVVRSKVIPDTRGSGSSAALVQVAAQSEAALAIKLLNGESSGKLGLAPAGSHAPRTKTAPRGVVVLPPQKRATVSPSPTAAPDGGLLRVKFAGPTGEPNDNLYISGLPSPQVDEQHLHDSLVDMGLTVTRSRIIPDTKGSGSSAAMVQLSSVEEAQVVIDNWNGQRCPLEAANFSWGAPAAPAGNPYTSTQRAVPGVLNVKFAGQEDVPSDNLYITGLPSPQVTLSKLNAMFERLNLTIIRSKIIPDTKGIGCSAAMVQLASVDEAHTAIEELQGLSVGIDYEP